MKVEHSVSLIQQSKPPEVHRSIGEASMQNSYQELDTKDKPASMSEEPHVIDDAHPASEKLGADLVFERDELLGPDSHPSDRISHAPKVWKVNGLNLTLSALEATVAVKRGVFTYDDFEV
jgi:hypothetical protein